MSNETEPTEPTQPRKPRYDLNTEQGVREFLEWVFSDDDCSIDPNETK